jgi:hypothetical protein
MKSCFSALPQFLTSQTVPLAVALLFAGWFVLVCTKLLLPLAQGFYGFGAKLRAAKQSAVFVAFVAVRWFFAGGVVVSYCKSGRRLISRCLTNSAYLVAYSDLLEDECRFSQEESQPFAL